MRITLNTPRATSDFAYGAKAIVVLAAPAMELNRPRHAPVESQDQDLLTAQKIRLETYFQ